MILLPCLCVSVFSAIVNSSHTCWAEFQLTHSKRWHISTENIELNGRSIEAAPAVCICRGNGWARRQALLQDRTLCASHRQSTK